MTTKEAIAELRAFARRHNKTFKVYPGLLINGYPAYVFVHRGDAPNDNITKPQTIFMCYENMLSGYYSQLFAKLDATTK